MPCDGTHSPTMSPGPCTLVTLSSKTVADTAQSVLKASPADYSGSQGIPPWTNKGAHPTCGLSVLLAFPCDIVTGAQPSSLRLRAVVAFPCGSHRSTAPLSGGLLYVSTRGVSQAVYQPPSCPPTGGVGGHACQRS